MSKLETPDQSARGLGRFQRNHNPSSPSPSIAHSQHQSVHVHGNIPLISQTEAREARY